MRVAWDLQAVTGPGRTGLGVSVQFMLDAVAAHATEIKLMGLRPNETNAALRSVPDRIIWEQWRLPQRLWQAHRQQPLVLAYSPALGAPLRSPVPVMAHVHDLIPLVYPRQFSGVARWYWRSLLPHTWRRCRALTVSNASVADDIAARLGYPRSDIHIVPYYPDPAVGHVAGEIDPDFANPASARTPERALFITLASHEPRKNIELPIRALGRLHDKGISARLVCIGGRTAHTAALRTLAEGCGVAAQVEFPGYLERRAAVELMLSCTALLFISHYEGYGMPPQEAQSVGCPVILSDIRCHRTVYADEQRLSQLPQDLRLAPPFIESNDEEALAAQMQRLIEDAGYRALLRRVGLAYAQTFSARDTAHALQAAFQAAAV